MNTEEVNPELLALLESICLFHDEHGDCPVQITLRGNQITLLLGVLQLAMKDRLLQPVLDSLMVLREDLAKALPDELRPVVLARLE